MDFKKLIEEKQASKKELKFFDAISYAPKFANFGKLKTNEAGEDEGNNPNQIKVRFVGIVANWYISKYETILSGKALKDAVGQLLSHNKDHDMSIEGMVGEVQKVEAVKMKWKDLGIDFEGETTALIIDSIVHKEMNSKVFFMYKKGLINQHSLSYYNIESNLGVNSLDEEYKEYKEIFDTYKSKIPNLKENYFWIDTGIEMVEVSSVFKGACILTPTLEVKENKETIETNKPSILEQIAKQLTNN